VKHFIFTALLILLGASSTFAQTPDPITRAAPLYPLRALDRGIEGWVELTFTLTPDGIPVDIAVTDAYPKGLFDKPAKAALAQWRYPPAEAARPGLRLTMPFALLTVGSVRAEINERINAALKAVAERRPADADAGLAALGKIEGLTLAEYALFERARGLARFTGGAFAEAVVSFERALALFGRKLAAKPQAEWARLLVMARVNARQFPEAVADFDAWQLAEAEVARDIAPSIAQIRDAIARGRPMAIDGTPASPN
jgi:TonB family protein